VAIFCGAKAESPRQPFPSVLGEGDRRVTCHKKNVHVEGFYVTWPRIQFVAESTGTLGVAIFHGKPPLFSPFPSTLGEGWGGGSCFVPQMMAAPDPPSSYTIEVQVNRTTLIPMNCIRRFAILAAIALLSQAAQGASPVQSAEALISQGDASVRTGDFAAAADDYKKAAAAYINLNLPARRCAALSAQASALCGLGQYTEAIQTLRTAANDAATANDSRLQTFTQIHLAEAMILSRNDEMGYSRLPEAESILHAASASDPSLQSSIFAALGDLQLARGQPDQAAENFQQALTASISTHDTASSASAAANAALAELSELHALRDPNHVAPTRAIRQRRAADAISAGDAIVAFNDQARAFAAQLPASHQTAYLWLTIGQTEDGLADADKSVSSSRQPDPHLVAYAAYQSVLNLADAIGDIRAKAYAIGYTAHLYELAGRTDEAMVLTRQAAFLAQQIQDSDCLYRWQWQTGRLLRAAADQFRAKGDIPSARQSESAAIDSYRAAASTLQTIRTDISAGGGNQPAGGSFHGVAEGVFYELADLLLRQADNDAGATELAAQHVLLEARDTVEQLKTAQVQNYFHERCDALIQSKGVDVATIDAKTAVIYLIPLPDRTEILVAEPTAISPQAPNGYVVRRFRANVSEAELTSAIRNFRLQLMDVTTNDYGPTAAKLYDWLIRPMDAYLQSRGVDTLVFIPDGPLRTIPMAALYDGNKFLIEKYAVTVSPGLRLTEPRPLTASKQRLLTSGISVSRRSLSPLANVPAELSNLHALYGGESLLDSAFSVAAFDEELSRNDYSIIHIASHGQFGDDPSQTFIQAFDGPMDLNHLEHDIEPSKYKGNAVELLTLSACETAAGNDRAALGLAGVALKAGARSALATLWSVNDQASADLIADFYRRLKSDPHLTKAQALRQTQMQLIENNSDVRFQHPFFWSPYLIIGNWL